jgi:exopolysaccharide production protein ExoZ
MSGEVAGGQTLKRLDWIDALRGYAIIGVMMGHLHLLGPPAPVQLFFLASGIALMYSNASHGDQGPGRFYIRRFFRIAPMFWASIPLFYLQNLITGDIPADLAQIVSAATFTHWVKPQWNNSAVPGSWSIACEITFYLFFPFVAARVTNVRRGIGLVAISVALAICMWPILIWYAAWTGVADVSGRHAFTFYSFSTQAPCFAIGIMTFRLLEEKQSGTLIAGLLGLATIVALWQLREHGDRYYLFNVAGYAAIAYALGNGKLELLVNRPICAIGLVSYSAYFWHFMVLAISVRYLPDFTDLERAALVIPVTLALSALTYRAIEKPMMRLGARLASTVILAHPRRARG